MTTENQGSVPEQAPELASEQATGSQPAYVTQEDLQKTINRLTAKERTRFERTLKERFGTANLDEIAQYANAGKAVAQKAGLRPTDVLSRLAGYQASGTQSPVVDSGVQQQLHQIQTMISEQQREKVVAAETAEAQKEFGQLYADHEDEILELAEERGLSVPDAAAVVLRPKLKDLYEQQARTRQQVQRGRKVEGASAAGAASGSSEEIASKLSAEQKRVFQKMGISYTDGYKQLKELGRIE